MRFDQPTQMPFASAAEHISAEFQWLDALLSGHVRQLRETGRFDESDLRGVRLDKTGVLAALEPLTDRRPADGLRQRIEARVAAGRPPPLYQIAARFGLTPFERDALMIAAAPALDGRYRAAIALAQNDATRAWPSPDLILALLAPEHRLERLAAFATNSPLMRHGLLRPGFPARPLADLALEVAERVALALCGSDLGFSQPLATALTQIDPAREDWAPDLLPLPPLHLHAALVFEGRRDVGQSVLAARRAGQNGRQLLRLALDRLPGNEAGFVADAMREAGLRGCDLFVDARAVMPDDAETCAALAGLAHGPMPVSVSAGPELAQSLMRTAPNRLQHVSLPDMDACARLAWWRRASADPDDPDLPRRAWRSRLGPSGIAAATTGGAEEAARLPAMLRRVPPRWSRQELILSPVLAREFDELVAFVSHWPQVLGTWGFAASHPQARRCLALLTGPPGTGKTMAASVVASAAGIPLYRVSLASIFDKYVGETEKQIDRLFDAAAEAGVAILCDEADALFGARSDGQEAHARYANLTVAHLLQRVEAHDGLVLLTSNLSQNMDEAFTRRIDHALVFPLPDFAGRKALWRRALPHDAPLDDDLDIDGLAEVFELSGGDISNAALAAGYLAAAEGTAIAMRHLLRAVERELAKAGRRMIAADFGHLVAQL